MDYQKTIILLVQILLIVGAINWGLVTYNGTDIVKMATGGGDIEKYVKYVVAAAGVYFAYNAYLAYSR
jgi:uncharacterized membrane protein YuzA (DUF378 family)